MGGHHAIRQNAEEMNRDPQEGCQQRIEEGAGQAGGGLLIRAAQGTPHSEAQGAQRRDRVWDVLESGTGNKIEAREDLGGTTQLGQAGGGHLRGGPSWR